MGKVIIKPGEGGRHSKRAHRLEVIFEFLIFGIVIGIVEDILAVKITTGEPITWKIVGIVVLIAIPFAIIGELIVDHVDFIELAKRVRKRLK